MDEANLRLTAFFSILAVMAIAEAVAPRKRQRFGRKRWPANLGIVAIDAIIVRLLIPAGATGAALWATEQQIGLLHLLSFPEPLNILIAVVLLDLAIYCQHVVFHAVPVLWRLHLVHHADRDIDVTTGLRFHPIEILLSMLIKIVIVILLGAPVWAVILFEIVLNGMAMFNHANVRLPLKIDSALRRLFITPDVHRIHHSIIKRETNSNYGFNLSIWDRLFGTFREQPEKGHNDMTIGLEQLQNMPTHNLLYMLRLPFTDNIGQYPMRNKAEGRDDV